jgi:hypothetical protein
MKQFSFKISGVSVSVKADNPTVFDTLKTFFSGYKFKAYTALKQHITLSAYAGKKAPVTLDKKATVLFSYGRIKGYRLNNGILLLSDKSTCVIVDEDNDRADAYLDMSILKRGSEFVSIFITIALIELLRHHGLYYLHAGAIKKHRNSILLCGMGMSGKTTLSLGLMSKGYRLASDDAVFLKHKAGMIQALGFKKDIHVTRKTLLHFRHRFKDIKPPMPPFKKAVIPYNIFQTVESIVPDTILFLRLAKSQNTKVLRIDKTHAMSLLIPQSLMFFFNKAGVNKHIDTLKALIHQTKTYICLCGRDLLKDPLIIFKSIGNG